MVIYTPAEDQERVTVLPPLDPTHPHRTFLTSTECSHELTTVTEIVPDNRLEDLTCVVLASASRELERQLLTLRENLPGDILHRVVFTLTATITEVPGG